MYRINRLPRKVLITTDEVIAMAPTENSVDPRNLLQSIQIAEDRFVKQAICKDLYNDFRSKKNVVVTDANKAALQAKFPAGVTLNVGEMVNAIELVDDNNYKDLWNEQLWKLVAECVLYIASPTNFSHYTSEGEMVNNPKTIGMDGQGSATVSLKDMQWKMDKLLMDRIDPLIASTQEYLCDNAASFPLYNCRKCCNEDGVSYKRKSAWIHGIYDNDNDSCEDCNDD